MLPAKVVGEIKPKAYKPLKPKIAMAVRMYACGQVSTQQAAAVLAGVKLCRFNEALHSPEGQDIVRRVQQELDFRYQALYTKFINVVDEAMSHVDPAIALAGASLYAKTQIGTKTKIELTAEDVVKQIIEGTYRREDEG